MSTSINSRSDMDQPFRFLDLPKELRFMVYEFLPIKTTHLIKPVPDSSNHHSLPQKLLKYVRETQLGISILAVCQLVNSEASTVIEPRLAAIQRKPLRFIVTPLQMDGFARWFESNNDVVDRSFESYLREAAGNHAPQSGPAHEQQAFHIAICNDGQENALFVSGMLSLFNAKYMRDTQSAEVKAKSAHVQIRPALLSPREREFFTEDDASSGGLAAEWRQMVRDGGGIREVEWEEDSAEGEHWV